MDAHGFVVLGAISFSGIPSAVAQALAAFLAYCAAFLVVVWVGLIFWSWKDARARTPHWEWAALATLLVTVFWLPGALIYWLVRPRETLAERHYRLLYEESMATEVESLPLCPACHYPIRPEFLACPACGATQRRPCPSCLRPLAPGWSHCPYCATPVTQQRPSTAMAEQASA